MLCQGCSANLKNINQKKVVICEYCGRENNIIELLVASQTIIADNNSVIKNVKQNIIGNYNVVNQGDGNQINIKW